MKIFIKDYYLKMDRLMTKQSKVSPVGIMFDGLPRIVFAPLTNIFWIKIFNFLKVEYLSSINILISTIPRYQC